MVYHKSMTLGPPAYQNWNAALAGSAPGDVYEFPLYSDTQITGELRSEPPCPYSFLNTLAQLRPRRLSAAVVLRCAGHLEKVGSTSWEATDTSNFYGGSLADELASLVALAAGIRLRAGGATRHFNDRHPLGRPQVDTDPPTLPPFWSERALRIRSCRGEHNLNAALAPVFLSYPTLPPSTASALARASRLYRDALWIVESEPELSWLFLVSAVEAASADHAPGMRPTKRFVTFLLEHLPVPPVNRPHQNLQAPWDPDSMEQAFRKIYAHRSCALHEGIPFPPPMSMPDSLRSEVPLGGTAMNGGVWLKKDMPMLISTFEYIARGALLKWWSQAPSVAGDDQSSKSPGTSAG